MRACDKCQPWKNDSNKNNLTTPWPKWRILCFLNCRQDLSKTYTTKHTYTSSSLPAFNDKKVTTSKNVKNKTKCYNYVGNHLFLSVYMRLADWSKHDLSDFEPVMVSKFKLESRQRRDVSIDNQIRDAYDPVKIKEKEKIDQQKQSLEDDVKRKRTLLFIEPPPKRCKISNTTALSQKEQIKRQEADRAVRGVYGVHAEEKIRREGLRRQCAIERQSAIKNTHTHINPRKHTHAYTLKHSHTRTHTHTRSHTHPHTHTHTTTHTHTHNHTRTHTRTRIHKKIQNTHPPKHSHSHTYTHTHTHVHTNSHTITQTHTHTLTLTYKHTYTHMHTITRTHTCIRIQKNTKKNFCVAAIRLASPQFDLRYRNPRLNTKKLGFAQFKIKVGLRRCNSTNNKDWI